MSGNAQCVHMVMEAVVDFHLSPETVKRRLQKQQRPPPRLCQLSPRSRGPTPTRTPLHALPPLCPPLPGQAACSSGCPLSAGLNGPPSSASSLLVTLAESPEEMTLLGAPVLPPADSPEHYLPLHQDHMQVDGPHLQQPAPPSAAGMGSWHMQRDDGHSAAPVTPMEEGSSGGGAGPAGGASAVPHSGYPLLQPTPTCLQQASPSRDRVGGHKRRVLSPDAAGMQRLTLGKAQKKLRLEGSNLGLTWQPMSAAKPAMPRAAAKSETTSLRAEPQAASPTRVGLPQQIPASLKQIKKRRVSLRLRAQAQATKPSKAEKPPKAPLLRDAPTQSSPQENTPALQAFVHSQPSLTLTHSSSSGSGKVSEEMAQSPHARARVQQSPACGLAQQHGASGCLYSGFFDQGPDRAQEGEDGGHAPASLSVGCQMLGKRPAAAGPGAFRSQKRLCF